MIDLNEKLLTKNACIYSNERQRLTESLLRRSEGVSQVASDGRLFRRPTFLKFQVGTDQVQLNCTFDRQKIKEHVAGMHAWVNHLHHISPIMNLNIFHQFIDEINQMYGVKVDFQFNFQSPVWKALLKIAEPIEGVIFVHNSFVDCDGRVLFGYLADLVGQMGTDKNG